MGHYPTRFEAYSVDRFIDIVKAWIEHSWPITAAEAQHVYESLGYSVDPEDPEMFTSPFADGKADSYYVTVKGLVSTVDIAVARPCNPDKEKESSAVIADAYATFHQAINSHYKNMISATRSDADSTEWTFTSDVELDVSVWNRSVSACIHSPYMTQLRREEREMGLTSYEDILEDD
jgi:hypothetical protein